MKVFMEGKNVFKFEAEPSELTWIGSCSSFEEAKKHYLKYIEQSIDDELQRVFIEFNRNYYSK